MNSALVCLLLAALQSVVTAVSLDKASQNLRQPAEEKNTPEVVKVENKVRAQHKKFMNAIDKFRADVCAQMKDEFGVSFKTFEACHKFMNKACKPGKDMKMDGDKQEVSSGEGFCKEYFPEAERKAKEEVEKEEEEEKKKVKAVGPSPGPYPGPSPAPAPKAEAEADAPAPAPKTAAVDSAPAGAAPSPGPAASPGPAPVPAPFIPGKSEGKPWGPIPEDEAWYYKGSKDEMSRMHMSEDQKLPVHGYWGKLVEHEDMQTVVGDWQTEFGPKAGLKSAAEVCRQYPESDWCVRKGFGRMHRASAPVFVHSVLLILALLAASMF